MLASPLRVLGCNTTTQSFFDKRGLPFRTQSADHTSAVDVAGESEQALDRGLRGTMVASGDNGRLIKVCISTGCESGCVRDDGINQ